MHAAWRDDRTGRDPVAGMTAGHGLPPDADARHPSGAVDVALRIAVLTMAPPIVLFLLAAFGGHGLVVVGTVLALAVTLVGRHVRRARDAPRSPRRIPCG